MFILQKPGFGVSQFQRLEQRFPDEGNALPVGDALRNVCAEMNWFRRKLSRTEDRPVPNLAENFSEAEVRAFLPEAEVAIENGGGAKVFPDLNRIKARRMRVEGVDLARARFFLKQQQPYAAIEALKEELRYFPESAVTLALLKRLAAEFPAPEAGGEKEFRELLGIVQPYTMVGVARLQSLYTLAKAVCDEDLPGNIVECGVAAGGSSALLATVISRYSKRPRRLYSFDTFEGMPPADARDTHSGHGAESVGWGEGTCSAPEDSLREVALKLDVAQLIHPVKGLFADTLPGKRTEIGPIAMLHMDGDWYSSTRDILVNIFDSVVAGGRIQIDDYGFWEGCKKAVSEFEAERNLSFDLRVIDETGVWMIKR